jgi:DnaK suppressor protein
MSTTTPARPQMARVADTPARGDERSLPPPTRLTALQRRELEAELRRELAALDRRLTNERAGEAADASPFATDDAAMTSHRTSDTIEQRRDAVVGALARLETGTYGTCARCAAPIPFGRLQAMPEATHCLSCPG